MPEICALFEVYSLYCVLISSVFDTLLFVSGNGESISCKNGNVLLIDEVLTPDSSRFWSVENYAPGMSPPSFDKQFVRDYLETLEWNKQPPAPGLPPEIVAATTERYKEAYRILTGQGL